MFWMNRRRDFIDQATQENLVQPIGSELQRLSRETGSFAARRWWTASRRHEIGSRALAREGPCEPVIGNQSSNPSVAGDRPVA
jgi:hypothetical protein